MKNANNNNNNNNNNSSINHLVISDGDAIVVLNNSHGEERTSFVIIKEEGERPEEFKIGHLSASDTQAVVLSHNSTSYDWRASKSFIVFVAWLGIFTDQIVYSIFIPILPFIVADVGGDSVSTGVLLLIYSAAMVIGAPIFGFLADRYKNKRVFMITGLSFLALGIIMMAFIKAYWVLIIVRFLQGLSASIIWTLGLALIADAYHNEESGLGQAMSWAMSGYTIGTVLGPPLGGALYAFSPLVPYLLCLGLIIIDVIGRMLVKEPSHHHHHHMTATDEKDTKDIIALETLETVVDDLELPNVRNSGSTKSLRDKDDARRTSHISFPPGAGAVSARNSQSSAKTSHSQVKKPQWGFKDAIRNRPLMMILAMIAAAGTVMAGIEPTLPLWLSNTYGLSTTQIGLIYLVFVGPNVVFGPVGGAIYERFGAQPQLSICMTLNAITLILPGITIRNSSGSPMLVWTCLALVTVSASFALSLAPMSAEISACVPREAYSSAYSLFIIAWSFGAVLGPYFGALTFEKVGWRWQMLMFCGFVSLSLPVAFSYRRRK